MRQSSWAESAASKTVSRASGWPVVIEYWLGWPTVETILANTLWPGALDRFLARKAVAGQETDTPASPDRRDNLAAPVGPLRRTRGSFSDEAATHALLIPAPVARFAVVGLGALACLVLGGVGLGLATRGQARG